MASPSTVITLGFGSFGSVNLLPTLGYGLAEEETQLGQVCGLLTFSPRVGGAVAASPRCGGAVAASPRCGGEVEVSEC